MRLFVKIDNTYEEITLYGTERIEIFSTFDNLESPTNLNSDYTQPFTAPRCRENNKIFREFVHIDNQLTTYDPTKKMPCLITNDARETIIAGECYLEKVDRDNYHINVNGSLSKVFGKLKDVDFDSVLKKKRTKNRVTNRYELVDSDFYNPLTASNVKLSWVTSRSRHTSYGEINPNVSLIPTPQVGSGTVAPIGGGLSSVRVIEPQYTETEAYINTLIGWSMTDADTYKDFETDKWLVKPNIMNTAKEGVYANQTFMSGYYSMRDLFLDNMKDGKSIYDKNSCYYADDAPIKFDDVNELSMQEFRSYYQHPFLWLKSWAEVYSEKVQSELGYTIDWGGTIEDTAIYMLPRFYDNDARNESTNELDLWAMAGQKSDYSTFTTYTDPREHVSKHDLLKTLVVDFNTNDNIILGVPTTIQEFKFTPRIRLRDYSMNGSTPIADSMDLKAFWNGYVNPILVEVGVAQSKQKKKYCFVPFPSNWSNESNYEHIKIHTLTDMYGDLGYELVMLPYECDWDFKVGSRAAFNAELELPITFAANPSMFNKEDVSMLKLNVKIETASTKAPFYHQNGSYIDSFRIEDQTVGIDLLSDGSISGLAQVKGSSSQRPSNRSGKAINMRNLLKDNDKSIFDILVGYTKLKHAVWVIDESNKTIVVKPCDEYLKQQYQYDNYLDITKNVDSDSIVQYPLSWDARIVRMKHTDNEYVGEYDTMQINTPNFIQDGDSIIDLFEEMNVCVMAQRIRDYYVDLHNVAKMKSPYILPITRGDYSNFYAHSNYSNESQHTYWQTSRAKQICSLTDTQRWFITDDTDIETFNNAYCWHSEMMYAAETNNSQSKKYVTRQNCDIDGSGFRTNIPLLTDKTSYTLYDRVSTIKDYITDYDINERSLLYTRPSEYLYDIFGDSRESFVYDTYKDYLSEVYNQNNRKIVCRAKLNYTEWTRIKRNPFVRYGDILCIVTSIEFWNENDKLCDITMRRIDNLSKLVKLDPITLSVDTDKLITKLNIS